jgi:glycosyltransferase involved in cell wall biosynthesis
MWVDGALGVSQYVLDALAANGIALPRAEVLYNGVEVAAFAGIRRTPFSTPDAAPVVTMMARLDTQKDHATLLRATADLTKRGQQIRLRLAGDGPLAASLATEARVLGITQNVEWLGFQPNIASVLEATDIAVLSTHFEGFGLVVAEAMAAARPVIATDVGPLHELIESGTTGILVPHQDSTALAGAIASLIANPPRARAIGLAAREVVSRRFTFDVTLQKFTDYVTRVDRRTHSQEAAI